MSDRRPTSLTALDDAALAGLLGEVAGAVAWPEARPAGAPDVAARVRVALQDRAAGERVGRPIRPWRTARRAIVLALAAALVLAAVAGAIGLGLPGLRLTLLDPPPTAAPASTPDTGTARPTTGGAPGARLGLGVSITLDDAGELLPDGSRLPTEPLGPPDAVYVDEERADQLAFVWAPRADLPATLDRDVGLLFMVLDGELMQPQFNEKVISGGTRLETVRVGGLDGFWIEGDPHLFFYRSGDGEFVEDPRRWVGDALIWSDGPLTYRLESALGRDATIELAARLP